MADANLADVVDFVEGMAEVEVKNKFAVGDELELIMPQGNRSFCLESMLDMDGGCMQEAPGAGYRVRIPCQAGDWPMALLARHLEAQ